MDDNNNAIPSDSTTVEYVIFEGVHREPKGKPLGEVPIKVIEDWYSQDVDSDYIKKAQRNLCLT